MIGTTIGNYVVKDKIGEGGMGVVYVAEHPRIGRKVAIKVLLPAFSQNQEVVSRFFTEARASSAIKNDHIIDIIDFGELPDRSSYIIMEWLEGEPLTTTIEREQRLPIDRTLHVARGVGRALQAAHERGIVHRDLKPDNIFLVTRGDDREFAKVLDFGIAKLLGNEGEGAPATASKTRTGAIIGTPMYMSPEQCRGVAVDERSDIYSFAVIVYQLLVGKVPFAADGLGELLLKHMTEDPTPLRELDPAIPETVERAVLRALSKNPDERHRHVHEFIAELGGTPTTQLPALRTTVPRTSLPTSPVAHVSAVDTIGAASGEAVRRTTAPRKSNLVYALVPIAIAGVAAAAIMLRPAAKEPAVVPPTPVAAIKVEPVAAPAVPAPPARVRVSVRATPPEARLIVDGREVANPYGDELVADGREIEVQASAGGFVSKHQRVTLDAPRDVAFVLDAEPRGSGGKHVKLPSAPALDGKPETRPDAKVAAKPEARPEAKVETPKPHSTAPVEDDKGPTIYKGTKAKLQTDDPYAK